MKKILLLIAFVSFSIISCSNDDDKKSSTSIYQGTWSGSYSGENDNGVWEANIDSKGVLTGTISSTSAENLTLMVNGSVNSSGVMNATYGNEIYAGTFEGKLLNNTGTGTWKNTTLNFEGTWQGSKQ